MKSYNLELNNDKHPILVMDREFKYDSLCNDSEKAVSLCNDIFHLNKLAEEHVIVIALDVKLNVLVFLNLVTEP